MKFIFFIFIALVHAGLIKRDGPKFLQFDTHQITSNTTLLKRDYVPEALTTYATYYAIDMIAGSNQQKFELVLDTGSSDLWVVAPYASCPYNSCKVHGTFDPRTSTTWKNLSLPIKDYYVDKTYSFGDYGTDNFILPNGAELKQLQFGSMYNTTWGSTGILGIDYPVFESSQQNEGQTYNNFPMALKAQGLIDKTAYSLYLNQPNTNGNILFGGIDKNRYDGDLVVLDVSTEDLTVATNDILIDGISLGFNGDLVLDSGSTSIFLQPEYVNTVWSALDVDDNGYTSCDQPSDKFMTFKFNGIDIDIPYSNLVRASNRYDQCWIGVWPTISGNKNYAGDFFLRSVYAAYNLDTRKIGIAPANYDNQGSNIVDFWF